MAKKAGNEELKKKFNEMDKDKSGCLSYAELKECLIQGNRNIPDSQIDEVCEFFDDGSGDKKITFEEFEKGLKKLYEFGVEVEGLFKQYDCDNSGFLDRTELKKILCESGHKFTDAEIDKILQEADPSGDGKICFEEFINAFS